MNPKGGKLPTPEEIDEWGQAQYPGWEEEPDRTKPAPFPPRIGDLVELLRREDLPLDIRERAEASLCGAIQIICDRKKGWGDMGRMVSLFYGGAAFSPTAEEAAEAALIKTVEDHVSDMGQPFDWFDWGHASVLLEGKEIGRRLPPQLLYCIVKNCDKEVLEEIAEDEGGRFSGEVRDAAQAQLDIIAIEDSRKNALPALPGCFTRSSKDVDKRIFMGYINKMVAAENLDALLSLYLIAKGELPDGCSGRLSATLSRVGGTPEVLLRKLFGAIDNCTKRKPPSPHPQQCLTDQDITLPAVPPRLDRLRSLLQRRGLPEVVRQRLEAALSDRVPEERPQKRLPPPKETKAAGGGSSGFSRLLKKLGFRAKTTPASKEKEAGGGGGKPRQRMRC